MWLATVFKIKKICYKRKWLLVSSCERSCPFVPVSSALLGSKSYKTSVMAVALWAGFCYFGFWFTVEDWNLGIRVAYLEIATVCIAEQLGLFRSTWDSVWDLPVVVTSMHTRLAEPRWLPLGDPIAALQACWLAGTWPHSCSHYLKYLLPSYTTHSTVI